MTYYSIKNALRLREMPRAEIEKIQVELLRSHIKQALKNPIYQNILSRKNFSIEDIRTLSDLKSLPITSRKDLDAHPADFCTVSEEQVADISLTSGTTGPPVRVPYTKNDLDRLAFNEAMAFYGAGVTALDRGLVCVTLDRCFIAGLAYYSGLIRLGAAAIRSGSGQPARQWELISRLKPTILIGVPTFLLHIAERAAARGHNPQKAGIRLLVTIGEPVRRPDMTLTPLGKLMTEAWDCPVSASYGATELETAICECSVGRGGHIHPELCLAEIVDEQGNSVEDGKPGELVVTPLGVEGFPLIRFCTGDITRMFTEDCSCGWQTEKIGPIEGRVAQRLKMRGTTIYPEAVFQVLQEINQIKASYIEVRSAYDLSDEVRVVIGGNGKLNSREVESLLQARLRVRPEVIVIDCEQVIDTMNRNNRKPKRFFDYRNK